MKLRSASFGRISDTGAGDGRRDGQSFIKSPTRPAPVPGPIVKGSDDQPRDDKGRWTAGGGGASGGGEEKEQKIRLTVQVFTRNGEPVVERIVHVRAKTEQEAVDTFMAHARSDLNFKFFGEDGVVKPSGPK